ncbi:Serine/threonine-protein kinase PknH [Mycolicibacterium vanbaalenii]|uniref:non-specific serine/threonine protein kinase n=1 Tax=Mycolicibacterium vanbaalenii TaxID=110539 RepID=A0A5S9RBE1_MYCVN|nr:serine/threonine-protein kinase [Mycolicibacterium vanbaalenii]CAA0138304.1 Serine/threonine-protein kinase PknH [Mycolicibacterium vanbaalenii]
MGYPNSASRLGTRFGPYELQSLIGVGGMGEVYRAYDTVRDRVVAIKLLRADMAADPSFQQRFRRESRMAARLQAPHVIPVHDFGEIDGVLYIDMRLVEGASLKDELRAHGTLPPARTAALVGQVAAALDAAHASGLVHRDIKPENVLLTPDDFVYLVDFGIAQGGGEANITSTGLVIGSCAYMAPERLNGGRGEPPSDVYSLACLVFECLTGRAPFTSGDLREVMGAHLFSAPPRPSALRHGLHPAFDDVISRGMAKNPADRYPSAGALAAAVRTAAAAKPAPAAAPVRPGPPPSTRQFSTADPNPAALSQVSRPPVPVPARPAPPRKSRTAPVLAIVTVALFGVAALLAAVLVSGSDTGGSEPRIAAPNLSAPGTASEESTPTTSATPIEGVSGTDAQGFVGHSARCDAGSTPAAVIRTANSLAVVCENDSGSYYYRGERLRDGASLELSDAQPAGSGFVAVNPADGARYRVQPDMLTISSNGSVDSAEPALEYGSA